MGKKGKNADFLDLPDPDAELEQAEQQEAPQAAAKPATKKKGAKKGGKAAKFTEFGDSGGWSRPPGPRSWHRAHRVGQPGCRMPADLHAIRLPACAGLPTSRAHPHPNMPVRGLQAMSWTP